MMDPIHVSCILRKQALSTTHSGEVTGFSSTVHQVCQNDVARDGGATLCDLGLCRGLQHDPVELEETCAGASNNEYAFR